MFLGPSSLSSVHTSNLSMSHSEISRNAKNLLSPLSACIIETGKLMSFLHLLAFDHILILQFIWNAIVCVIKDLIINIFINTRPSSLI